MALTLSTFNCRGIQDTFKRKKIFHYLRSVKSDIIFLQETHSTLNDESFWKTQWGAQAWFSSYASNSRGVAILISNSASVQVKQNIALLRKRENYLGILRNGPWI